MLLGGGAKSHPKMRLSCRRGGLVKIETSCVNNVISCIIANLCLFVYFLTFEKGRLPYIHPVGWLVGWLVDVTINFFQYIEA